MPENKKPICLVLGGSFNPPTIAHRDLLLEAIETIRRMTGRDVCGCMVPSSDAYVRRKMARCKTACETFPETMRLDMLRELCTGTDLKFSDVEFGDDGAGRTYEMLCKLRRENQDYEYRFVVGADKLRIIPRWREIEKLLGEFGLVVIARNRTSAKTADLQIRSEPLLSMYSRNITILDGLDGDMSEFSSTSARECFETGDYDTLSKLCGFSAATMMARYACTGNRYDGYETWKKWRHCET